MNGTLAESPLKEHGYWLARLVEDLIDEMQRDLLEVERRALLSTFYDEMARGRHPRARQKPSQRL